VLAICNAWQITWSKTYKAGLE
jgi:hypothetical protein